MVKFLLQEKVDINHRDVNGRSALFLAVSSQHTDTSAILLHNGAEMRGDNAGTSVENLARKQELRELLESHQKNSRKYSTS